eukprot:13426470-Alexandrium_andersonii.AAC.1
MDRFISAVKSEAPGTPAKATPKKNAPSKDGRRPAANSNSFERKGSDIATPKAKGKSQIPKQESAAKRRKKTPAAEASSEGKKQPEKPADEPAEVPDKPAASAGPSDVSIKTSIADEQADAQPQLAKEARRALWMQFSRSRNEHSRRSFETGCQMTMP